MTDWEKLTADVATAASMAFAALRSETPHEQCYVFVLYTDGDCWTILPSANTIERLQERIRGETDDMQIACSTWAPAEWAYEGWKADLFNDVYLQLERHRKVMAKSKTAFAEYKELVFGCMVNALRSFRESALSEGDRDAILLYVSSSDGDEAYEVENRSVAVLNPGRDVSSFLRRYGG